MCAADILNCVIASINKDFILTDKRNCIIAEKNKKNHISSKYKSNVNINMNKKEAKCEM